LLPKTPKPLWHNKKIIYNIIKFLLYHFHKFYFWNALRKYDRNRLNYNLRFKLFDPLSILLHNPK